MEAVLDNELEVLDREVEKSLETHVEVQIKKDVLQNIIKRLDRTRNRKAVVPITQGIYLYFDENQLVGRAINSNYSVEVVIPRVQDETENFTFLEGSSGGAVFMDAKFSSMVNSMPRKNVKIAIHGSKAVLSAGRSKFELKILDHLEFPKFMDQKEGVSFTIHPDVLKRMYGKTVYATSSSESRPVLMGVNHQIMENKLILVATDAHRLAQAYHEIEEEVENTSAVVPAEVIHEVMKQLDDTVTNVRLYVAERHTVYEMDNGTTVFSRLIEGSYPDTNRLIPTGYTTEVQFRLSELKDMVSRAMLVDQETPVKMLIRAEDKQARLISREAEKAGFVEDIAPVKGEGDNIKFGFNIRYLYDALANYPPDALIKIHFTTNIRPFIIRNVNGIDDNLDLILPVRLMDSDMDDTDVIIEDFNADLQSELE